MRAHIKKEQDCLLILRDDFVLAELDSESKGVALNLHWSTDIPEDHEFLCLKGLPKLQPTGRVAGRMVLHNGKQVERWDNQTDSGQNKLPPSADRWKNRARTYQGWADAMGAQWGKINP